MNKTNKTSMGKNVVLLKTLLLGMLFIVIGCNPDETQTVAEYKNLVLSDEFDTDDIIDSDIWTFDIGNGINGWGNNEEQFYTNRRENVSVQNGTLIIKAIKEDYNGFDYTSSKVLTKGLKEQAYGRFEARIQLPTGQGMWPAFWLLGANCGDGTADTEVWPNCGEIDVMEYRGQDPTVVHGSVHGPGYAGGNAITKSYALENDRFDTGFHVFGIEWAPEYINYYVDDVLYNQITRQQVEEKGTWVFDQPFYIIINLAVGGDFIGAPNEETVFPQTMLIDYVRVYNK
ncbi:MAG: beta-glucanase (GH16 family) [Flavobacteriales bacterium]|jgi:beta-glucanase (GH16 family)